MQSSLRIYKNHQQRGCEETRKIPIQDNPSPEREYSTSGQAESLIRKSKHRADELVRLAENEAAEIVSRAREEAVEVVEAEKKKGFEAGRKDGNEVGYGEGYGAGRKESIEKSEKIIESARAVLRAAHTESREYIHKVEREIVELSVKIAESVIQKEIEMDDSIVIGIAQAALAEMRNRRQIIIRAGKRESMALQDKLPDLGEFCPNAVFTILRDENVTAGGCVIESEIHVVDATIDMQLENIKRVLEETGRNNG